MLPSLYEALIREEQRALEHERDRHRTGLRREVRADNAAPAKAAHPAQRRWTFVRRLPLTPAPACGGDLGGTGRR